MTLWCFGDSFIAPPPYEADSYWISMIADELDIKDVQNKGISGSSLTYTYMAYDRANIQTDDYVIIALTNLQRQYFFLDRPEISEPNKRYKFPPKVTCAMDFYFSFLYHDETQQVQLVNFLHRLQHDTEKKNLKVILFNAFDTTEFISNLFLPNLYIVSNNFLDIAVNEVEIDYNNFIKQFHFIPDPRLNHLCLSNHKILANKVIDYLINNQPNTLDNFKSNINNQSAIDSMDFHIREFGRVITKESQLDLISR